MTKFYFYLFLFIYNISLLYLIYTTPITPHEAYTLYNGTDLVGFLIRLSSDGINFWTLRTPFYLFGILNIYLYYQLSKEYFSKQNDIYLSTSFFLILPGIITSIVLANIAVVIISLVLIFLLSYKRGYLLIQILMMILILIIHKSSIIFFISIFIYSIFEKKSFLMSISFIFLTLSILMGGLEIGGKPSGHFIEIFGLYSAVFSPLVFIFFFYSMYRILIRESKDILWYLSFSSLVFSLILSIRQKIEITDFAPYVLISIALMLNIYLNSLRVRIYEHQKGYKLGFIFVVSTLIISSVTIILHQNIFNILNDNRKHFAYSVYKPYWLSTQLKEQNIFCYDTNSIKQESQFLYYGLKRCHQN